MRLFQYKLKKQSLKEDYLWNMAGNLCNAAHSVLMLAFVSRFCGVEDAGIFSLTFSISQMMYLISCFEMTNVLVTDSQKTFLFLDTVCFRIITTALMVVCASGFCVLQEFDGLKRQTFMLLILYMVLLTVTELCECNLHRNGRLALAGRSLAINITVNAIVFATVLYLTRSMPAAIVGMCLATIVWLLIYDFPYICAAEIHKEQGKVNTQAVKQLLIICAPLLCMRLVMSYIINAPKLAIDQYLVIQQQSFFGYMMMPAACVNLLSLFALRPQLVNLAKAYSDRDRKWFLKIVSRLTGWNVAIAICVIIGGYLLGIPILSVFYGVDLSGYEMTLCIVLLGGCFYAFATLFDAVATTMRTHYWNLAIYLPTFLLASALSGYLVKSFGLMGAAWSYMLMMLLLAAGSGVILTITVKKKFTE